MLTGTEKVIYNHGKSPKKAVRFLACIRKTISSREFPPPAKLAIWPTFFFRTATGVPVNSIETAAGISQTTGVRGGQTPVVRPKGGYRVFEEIILIRKVNDFPALKYRHPVSAQKAGQIPVVRLV
jgi:hypothetical protein